MLLPAYSFHQYVPVILIFPASEDCQPCAQQVNRCHLGL